MGSDRFKGTVFEIFTIAVDPTNSVDQSIYMTIGFMEFVMPISVSKAPRSRFYRLAKRVYSAGSVASAAGK